MTRQPLVKRYVDGVAVLHPRFYPDQGPDGFFPELQYPTQTRLAVRWNEHLGMETYIQLNAIFLTGIKRVYGREDLRRVFRDISTELKITLFQVHAKYPEEMIAILEFAMPHQAEEALLFANSNSRLFGDGHFFARYLDINAKGPNAGSTDDILLVREDFALSSPYTPRTSSFSLSPRQSFTPQLQPPLPPSLPPVDSGWHAVGYSRDSFAAKRPLSPNDRHWSPPRKRRSTEWDAPYGPGPQMVGFVQ
ncbi:hypothetical protein IAT40_001305 [Kwoniella sp. CBS 6097]